MAKFSNRFGRQRGARKQRAQGRISQRLIEFAQPLIDGIVEETGAAPTEEQLRSLLSIAVAIWNAQVMEQVGRDNRYADQARQLLTSLPVPPEARNIVDEMLTRKAREFSDDLRYIGHFDVYKAADGELRVRAEARLEAALHHEH